MSSYSTCYESEFSTSQLFEMVKDVEKYPEYLPWCSNARIIKNYDDIIEAELTINIPPISQKYTSKVILFSPKEEYSSCSIKVELIKGPFKYLNNRWNFSRKNVLSQVEFIIDFECSSKFLDKIIGKMFESALEKMTIAFKERAIKLYGSKQVD